MKKSLLCPKCKSDDVFLENMKYCGDYVSFECVCQRCGVKSTAYFNLTLSVVE